jgi:HTH-type transcriptional regulator/antitoxin HigA
VSATICALPSSPRRQHQRSPTHDHPHETTPTCTRLRSAPIRLLAQTLPAVIHRDAECERVSAEIDKLLRKGVRNLSPEEERLQELFSVLVEQYEDEAIVFPPSPPSRRLHFLLEQNDLQPADLEHIFGSGQRVSDVVNGKRAISDAQAKALGEFFKVSPELFH